MDTLLNERFIIAESEAILKHFIYICSLNLVVTARNTVHENDLTLILNLLHYLHLASNVAAGVFSFRHSSNTEIGRNYIYTSFFKGRFS